MLYTVKGNKLVRYLFMLFVLLTISCLSLSAFAATYYADTDGDGTNETITTNVNNISVFHPRTGQTNYYYYYTTYDIYKIIDADGTSGAEIIVVWSGASGAGIDVIHDRTQQTSTYSFNGLQFAIYGTADTDGQAGSEIIVIYCQGCTGHFPPNAQSDCAETNLGTAVSINVLANDRAIMSQSNLVPSSVRVTVAPSHGTAQAQSDGSIMYTPVAGFADIDYFKYTVADSAGAVSNEATVSVHVGASSGTCVYSASTAQEIVGTTNTNALQGSDTTIEPDAVYTTAGIRVINDRTKSVFDFSFNGTDFTINSVTDTDGLAGNEIIVPWQNATLHGIRILRSVTWPGSYHEYYPPIPYYIESVRDYDNILGAEICYSYVWGSGFMYGLITDKTQQTKEGPSGCASLTANVPIAPSNLAATAISTSEINLSWTDNSTNEVGFRIERKTGTTGIYAQITTVGTNVTSYLDAGLASSTTYFYRVMAYNTGGNSTYSNEVNATTTTSPPPPPSACWKEGEVCGGFMGGRIFCCPGLRCDSYGNIGTCVVGTPGKK